MRVSPQIEITPEDVAPTIIHSTVVAHGELQPLPLVRPVVLTHPDYSHSQLETPSVTVHPDIPEPTVIVKPIVRLHEGRPDVVEPVCIGEGSWWTLGYSFVLGVAVVVSLINVCKTWSVEHLFTRYSVLIMTVAFVLLGCQHWFKCSYTYEMRFVNQNVFYMLLSMALFH